MSDIVQRLRRKTVAGQPVFPTPLDIEAADEIERLRDIISPGDAAAYEEGMAALLARCETAEARLAEAHDLLAYVDELRSRLAEAERDADQLLKERDHAEGMADKLADALATMLCVDIGEHSSGNCPWTEALEAFEERATDSASVEGEK